MIDSKRFFIRMILVALATVFALPMSAQSDAEPILVDGCRPLLAPDCVIDDMVDEVKAVKDYKHPDYDAVLDGDLTNCMAGFSLTSLVDVGLLYKPIISVRDINNKYKGGNGIKAGFMVSTPTVSGSLQGLLDVNVLKTLFITLYNDNKQVYSAPLYSGDSGLLSLGLLNFGSQSGTSEFSIDVPATNDDGNEIVFDEVMLSTSGVDVNLLSGLSVYYGFVGESQKEINITNFSGISDDTGKNYLVDGNSETTEDWSVRVGSHSVTIDCKGIISDLQQKEIGFVYSNASVFKLEVLPTVTITFIKSGTGRNGDDEDLHKVSPTTLLEADLVAGQKIVYSAIPTTGFQWDKVKISFIGLVKIGQSSLHHAFVRDIQLPEQSNQCDLGFFADELICGDAPSYTFPNDIALTWSLESIVAQDGITDITRNYMTADIIEFTNNSALGTSVTFLADAPQGIYTFRGTDKHGCTGTVKVYRGKTDEMQQATEAQTGSFTFLNSVRDKVHLSVADEGSLISIDNLKNSANVIDGNLNTCATYAKGLQLLANTGIVSVKKDDGMFDAGTAVVGYVVETPAKLLGADVLKFYNIVLYKNGQEIYRAVQSENDAIQASLLGAPGSAKVRYAIVVPEKYRGQFDEFALYTTGVLNLDLTGESMKIYAAFVSDDEHAVISQNPLENKWVQSITQQTTGAAFNYAATGNTGLVSAVTVLSNLGYIIDGQSLLNEGGDEQGAVSYAVANVLGSTDISVKTGKRFKGGRWVGFVMKKPTGLGDVDLLSQMELSVYKDGSQMIAASKENNFLGANLIGWGDYAYFSLYVESEFDEVRFRKGELVKALEGVQYLGFYTYADADADGIPDEEDPDYCEPEDPDGGSGAVITFPDAMTDGHICASMLTGASITISGSWKGYCVIRDRGTDEIVFNESVDITGAPYSISMNKMKYGRYELILLPEDALSYVVNEYFTIHAERTEWSPKSPEDTDWNNWDNWTHGTPIAECTDVVIPSNCVAYPVLEDSHNSGGIIGGGIGDDSGSGTSPESGQYGCRYIHFEPNAEVQNTYLLTYKKAWVDLELTPGRYYMLTSPLKSTYTGDFFVPDAMNGMQNNEYFEVLDETKSPENRFNPRIYQRMWKTTAPVVPEGGKSGEVSSDATLWIPPFNALNQEYRAGVGFSLKADAGTVTGGRIRFRFPKEHTTYYYYNEKGQKTDLYERLDSDSYGENPRSNAGRFITEEGGRSEARYQLNIPAGVDDETSGVDDETSDVFLVGNPYMCHVNIQKFIDYHNKVLYENSNSITSLKVYDGNAINSYILHDGELLTNSADGQTGWTSIAPMQAFFVTTEKPTKVLNITYDSSMFETKPGSQLLRSKTRAAQDETPHKGFRLTATAGDVQAGALVLFSDKASDGFDSREDAAMLVDEEVKPQLAVYTLAGEKAADIQQQRGNSPIEIGFYMKEPQPVTLRISNTANDEWILTDRKTGNVYELDDETEINLGQISSNVGRWIISRLDESMTDKSVVFAESLSNGKLSVSTDGTVGLKSMICYDESGRVIDRLETQGVNTADINSVKGLNIIQVVTSDGNKHILKIMAN